MRIKLFIIGLLVGMVGGILGNLLYHFIVIENSEEISFEITPPEQIRSYDSWETVSEAKPRAFVYPDRQVALRWMERSSRSAVHTPEIPVEPAKESTPEGRVGVVNVPAPVSGNVWDQLAQCESTGNWQANTGNGYYGGIQFSLRSWNWVGGTGYPHQHSREDQIAMGERLLARQGWAKGWPACSKKLGLR